MSNQTQAAAAPKFTHLVEFFLKHPIYGRLPGSFRTTDDAVEIHRVSLADRETRGEVCGIRITKIAGAA